MKQLCFNEDGSVRTKNECRAVIINKLILDELMDIDEAEDLVEKSLREWNLWNEETGESEEAPTP